MERNDVVSVAEGFSLRYLLLNHFEEDLGNNSRGMTAVASSIQNPISLQKLCQKSIRKAVGLRRLEECEYLLPLPRSLVKSITKLELNDFKICADMASRDYHFSRMFPACCLLDSTLVLLKFCHTARSVEPDQCYIGTFEYYDIAVHIFNKTPSFLQIIAERKETQELFSEHEIWQRVKELVRICQELTPEMKVFPENIYLNDNRRLFYRVLAFPDNDVQLTLFSTDGIYEAPECLKEGGVRNEYSRVWTISCLAYELATFTAAFQGCSPFVISLGQNVDGFLRTQLPLPSLPKQYSSKLNELIQSGTKDDPRLRPSFSYILNTAEEAYFQ